MTIAILWNIKLINFFSADFPKRFTADGVHIPQTLPVLNFVDFLGRFPQTSV